jgi:imidazolonepropionase-like amidohydrolase
MKTTPLLFLASLFFSIHFLQAQTQAVVLKGGTLLDFDAYGLSQNDMSDAVVLLQGGKIVQVGKQKQVNIPKGAQIVDVSGKYLGLA